MNDPKIKLLRYMDRVIGVIGGVLKPPIMADVDVWQGTCDLDCEWCAQRGRRQQSAPRLMKPETMVQLGRFCAEWGVKSWRIAGESEPTINHHLPLLLQSGHDHGIAMGLITNGMRLDRISNLRYLTWLGISLDAATGETWRNLKHAPIAEFDRIIATVQRIRRELPALDITLKFVRWRETDMGRSDFGGEAKQLWQISNYHDAKLLPELAKSLGVSYSIRDALPKNMPDTYRFAKCRATPLYATFGADRKFHICCDQRGRYVLTDDYTRNGWQEIPALWGGQKHIDLINSIDPQQCRFCSKEWLNTVFENIILNGERTKDFQVEFI